MANQEINTQSTKCDKNKGFCYDSIVQDFGVEYITEELLERFIKVTGKEPHTWLKRGIFFSHRDLDKILDDKEKGLPVYLYTGRGPTTESLHLGHMVQFMFIKWLQDVFDAIVVIQMADTEKYYFKNLDFDNIYSLQFENVKDIIACGFNPKKTFIFSDYDYSTLPGSKRVIIELHKKINMITIKSIFGLKNDDNIGCYVWPIHQMAASLSKYFPIFGNNKIRCLITYAIDQDPYFRGIRDKAHSLNSYKPCSIISKFLPALEGNNKMSSTTSNKTIFMTDNATTIKNTIKKAYTGCKQTLEEHRIYGANLEIDVPYQYLRYFLLDDLELDKIGTEYSAGRMTASEVKTVVTDVLTQLITQHQEKRSLVTQDTINYFYSIDKFSIN